MPSPFKRFDDLRDCREPNRAWSSRCRILLSRLVVPGGRESTYVDLFDADEYNAMFTSSLNFYDRAVEWTTTHGKPIVANCDVHRLHQLDIFADRRTA